MFPEGYRELDHLAGTPAVDPVDVPAGGKRADELPAKEDLALLRIHYHQVLLLVSSPSVTRASQERRSSSSGNQIRLAFISAPKGPG